MVYADYDFYCNEYFGKAIPSEEYQRLALRGSQYIDYITQGRAEARADLEAVKMCCCALAEQHQTIETAQELAQKSLSAVSADGTEVSSETVGSWSRSFRSGGESAQSAAQAAAEGRSILLDVTRQYLAPTGLLYRGGRCCR